VLTTNREVIFYTHTNEGDKEMNELINLIKNAAAQVNAENAEFGYNASKGEVAAQVWHSYLTPMQRYELAKGVKGSNVKAVRECYAKVEALI